jgi:plastocyanin
MRRLSTVLAATGAILLLVAGPALAGEVTLADGGFDPVEHTVAPGATIVWTNASGEEHTVIAEDGAWDSGPLSPGDTFSLTLRTEGTFAYGTEDGAHTATIVVSAEAAPEDDAEAPEEGEPEPVTPVTGLPVSLLAAAVGLLLASGAALVSLPARR